MGAPAATLRRGQATPRRSVSVSSRWGRGPGAGAKRWAGRYHGKPELSGRPACDEMRKGVTLASRGWRRTGRLGTPTRLPRWGPRPAGRGGVARDKRFSPSTPGVPCTISHRQLEMESSDIGNSFRRSSVHQAFAFGLSAEPAEPPPRPLQRRAPQTGERSGDRHRPIVVVGVRYRVLGEAKRFGGNG